MAMTKRLLTLFIAFFLPIAAFCGRKEEPKLIAGVLSDVHIHFAKPQTDSVFLKALEFFRAQDVDAMLITGDLINDGVEEELIRFTRIWNTVFPDDKGRKGKHVEKVFVYGNHEIEGHTYGASKSRHDEEYMAKYNVADHREEFWEKYFHEPYQPFYRKEIKGYTFLASQYINAWEAPGMDEWFKQQEATFPSNDKPIFYIQHKHPRGTVPRPADNGNSTKILSRYPNIICFSGHTHRSLTDELWCIWQGSFTSVSPGALYNLGTRPYHENGAKQKEGHISQMKVNKCGLGHHGILMKVYEDRVELHRYDFHNDMPLGVWTIPTDVTQRPYGVKLRQEQGAHNPPQFEKRAKVSIEKVNGKNREGKRVKQIKVEFPVVVSHGSSPRALDYKILVEKLINDEPVPVLEKLVYSHHFYMYETADKRDGAWCVFAESELPEEGPFRFAVYPQDSFGNAGNPIYSSYMIL